MTKTIGIARCLDGWARSLVRTTDNGLAVGVDMNCGQVTVSNGDVLLMPGMARLEHGKCRHQRMVAKQKQRSLRRDPGLSRMCRGTATTRHRWHHEPSRTIVDTSGMISVEDLRARVRTRSAECSVENSGSNAWQKAGLNREIRYTSWSQLRRMLERKATRVHAGSAAETSQAFRSCGTNRPAVGKPQSSMQVSKHSLVPIAWMVHRTTQAEEVVSRRNPRISPGTQWQA